MIWRGEYNATERYLIGDAVGYLGSSYVCYVQNTLNVLPTDEDNWEVVAAHGLPGTAGTIWYDDNGAPDPGIGINGDFYLNRLNGDYYKKVSGTWELQGNLTGPQGDPGPGLPAGGSIGQLPVKSGAPDYDVSWAALISGAGIDIESDGGDITITGTVTQYSDEMAQDAVGTILTDTSTIDFTYDDGTPSISADVINNSISNAKLRQGAAASVVGVSGNAIANVADIVAGSDGDILRRAAGVLGFGQIASTSVSDFVEASQDAVGNILVDTATIDFTYGDSTPEITASVIDNSISNAKIRQGVALSVVGVTGNATSNVADIAAGSDGDILRRSGTTLGFGSILSTSVSNFNEAAQDAVGNILTDSLTIDFTYDDAANTITAIVIDASITFEKLATAAWSSDGTLGSGSNTVLPTQGAVKTYVDNAVSGLKWKQSARVASTANGTLASAYANGQTVDGVVIATGDRILLKNQTTQTENGIYIVQASGAPVRSTDADTGSELVSATLMIQEGTQNADTQWTCTNNAITIGVTNIAFAQVSAGGTQTGDGTTITLTGNVYSVTTNGIGNSQIRQSAGLSVVGRSANSTGNVADITAVTSGHVLRLSGTTLGFGTLLAASFADGTIVPARLVATTGAIFGATAAGNGVELTGVQAAALIAAATTTQAGVQETATDAEFLLGTAIDKFLTPSNMSAQAVFTAYRSGSDQTGIADNTDTTVQLNAASPNIGTVWNTATFEATLTAGFWLFVFQCRLSGTFLAGSSVSAGLQLDTGGGYASISVGAPTAAIIANISRTVGFTAVQATAGNKIRMYCNIDTTSGTGTVVQGPLNVSLVGIRIRP